MSKNKVIHKLLLDLLSRVHCAEGLSFCIKYSLDDLDQSSVNAFKHYVDEIQESLVSLVSNLDIISICFFGLKQDSDLNEDSNHE